jgi:hypothetical protein
MLINALFERLSELSATLAGTNLFPTFYPFFPENCGKNYGKLLTPISDMSYNNIADEKCQEVFLFFCISFVFLEAFICLFHSRSRLPFPC